MIHFDFIQIIYLIAAIGIMTNLFRRTSFKIFMYEKYVDYESLIVVKITILGFVIYHTRNGIMKDPRF